MAETVALGFLLPVRQSVPCWVVLRCRAARAWRAQVSLLPLLDQCSTGRLLKTLDLARELELVLAPCRGLVVARCPSVLMTRRVAGHGSNQRGSHAAQSLESLLSLFGAVSPLQVHCHPTADR